LCNGTGLEFEVHSCLCVCHAEFCFCDWLCRVWRRSCSRCAVTTPVCTTCSRHRPHAREVRQFHSCSCYSRDDVSKGSCTMHTQQPSCRSPCPYLPPSNRPPSWLTGYGGGATEAGQRPLLLTELEDLLTQAMHAISSLVGQPSDLLDLEALDQGVEEGPQAASVREFARLMAHVRRYTLIRPVFQFQRLGASNLDRFTAGASCAALSH
jgi:hypothetical protein